MASDPLPATLSFLTDAAHLLLAASPETSAHLMSQRNALMFHNDVDQPDVQRQHVCGCCGHIMIPGQGDLLKMDSTKSGRKRNTSVAKSKGKDLPRKNGCRKTLTCSKCGRYTRIDIPAPPHITRRQFKQQIKATTTGIGTQPKLANLPTAAPGEVPNKTTANASSKKRAKNRKQGLQALLQNSSISKPQGLGLSLADFMQH
ncbi:hypothetical protein GGS20DRAFT_468660 [Poronia punctata]|nr:hypothetical protein GGS20DRAFT_468660 [Poronia punctata]